MDIEQKVSKYKETRKVQNEEILLALHVDGYNFLGFDDDIFLLDYWSEEEGLNYIVGILNINDCDKLIDDYLVDFAVIQTLEREFYSQDEEPHIFNAFKNKLTRLERFWFSGSYPQSNPPSFYIDWALSKKIDIPWLNYAIEKGFYIPKSKVKESVKVEKQLSTRLENNYLRLILTLANSIEGFNPKKPYEAAQLIIDETGIDISKQTISDYITKAYEIESQKRD